MVTDEEFTWRICPECGVKFALPTLMYNHCRDEGGYFSCPNGHSRGWPKGGNGNSDYAILQRERDRLKQDAARLEEEQKLAWRTASEHLTRAQKAEKEAARIKKRAVSAVCPCCNRSFSQLARHMATKHPGVSAIAGARREIT